MNGTTISLKSLYQNNRFLLGFIVVNRTVATNLALNSYTVLPRLVRMRTIKLTSFFYQKKLLILNNF